MITKGGHHNMIYKVPLYIPGVYKEVIVMQNLLVRKDSLGIHELFTDRKIKLSTFYGYSDYYQYSKNHGYGAFIKSSDLNSKNKIELDENTLQQYIDSFSVKEFELFCSLGKTVHKKQKAPTNIKKLSATTKYLIGMEKK